MFFIFRYLIHLISVFVFKFSTFSKKYFCRLQQKTCFQNDLLDFILSICLNFSERLNSSIEITFYTAYGAHVSTDSLSEGGWMRDILASVWAALSCRCKYSVGVRRPHPDIMWSVFFLRLLFCLFAYMIFSNEVQSVIYPFWVEIVLPLQTAYLIVFCLFCISFLWICLF